jgi:hypothetical protein
MGGGGVPPPAQADKTDAMQIRRQVGKLRVIG